jgi:hypothetical protein
VNCLNGVFVVLAIGGTLSFVPGALAQDAPSGNPPAEQSGRGSRGQEAGPRPVFGKITAIQNGVMEITGLDGQTLKVKFTDQTEFRKDRQAAKASDFKAGDMVMVRGQQGSDHTITATLIGARTGGTMYTGPAGGGGMGGPAGTLGKDYVIGQVKAIDPPRMTVLRTDNVTQTLELNEETSLHKGRESITMADIQVGDHIISRGEVQKDVFVPKGVMVLGPEQWKRFQEFQGQVGDGNKPAATDGAPPKPQE